MTKKLLCFALGAALLALTGCESLFFFPDKALRYHPNLCAAEPVNMVFAKEDGELLHSWYFKPKEGQIKGVIFYLHGNAQNISFHIHGLLWLLEKGYAIYAFDYSGYGISEGDPSIKAVVQDSLAAFDFFISGKPQSDKIIVLGQSMGGAAAIDMSALTPHADKITALVADSAFSSWRRIYREKAAQIWLTWPFQYPISWFINDDYAPEKFISRVPEQIKILLIQNEGDIVVDQNHADRLYEAAQGRAELWKTPYEGHTNALLKPETQERFLNFLDGL